MKTKIKEMFMSKAIEVIITLRYTHSIKELSIKTNSNYPYILKLLSLFQEEGLLTSSKVGRKNEIVLTQRGIELSIVAEAFYKKLEGVK